MKSRRTFSIGLVLLTLAAVANASWYDDYDDGVKAANAGNWSVVVSKMTAAINAKPKEGNKERTYGAIFINYHPYYYRGVANLRLGKYEAAVKDLEVTTGRGEVDLGSIDQLIREAKDKASGPAPPPPSPAPVIPVPPPTPAPPSIDPAQRGRAQAAIAQAEAKMLAARQRNAGGTQEFTQGLQQLARANDELGAARSNEDLNAVLASARNAGLFFDSAQKPVVPVPAPPTPVPAPPTPGPRPVDAGAEIITQYMPQIRGALTNYFNGDFDKAAEDFQQLSVQLPDNPWIWAFLGASQYSLYAFEAEDRYKEAARDSFARAKRSSTFRNGLPQRYFSRKVRAFFDRPS